MTHAPRTGRTPIIWLEPALNADAFETAGLRSRAAKAPLQSTMHLFRAMSVGAEVALVVLDVHENSECVILYELYLCAPERNRGLGTQVLAAVEKYATASGRGCVEVWPRSLDRSNRSDSQLDKWYRRHGYVSAKSGSPRLTKVLGQ